MAWRSDDGRTPTTLEKELIDAIAAETAWLASPGAGDPRTLGWHEGFREALNCVLEYFAGNSTSIVCDKSSHPIPANNRADAEPR